MKRATILPLMAAVLGVPAAAQDVPSLESLWEIIQQQQAEIDALKAQISVTEADVDEASESASRRLSR